MKKRGSVLATVLIASSILLILGSAVSAGVINTTKLNKKYSDNIDLELAAKSGVNIIKEDFISKVNKGDIKNLDNVDSYINEVNSGNLNNIFEENFKNDDSENDDIELELKLDLDSSDSEYRLKITSIAKKHGSFSIEKVEEDSLVLNIVSESTGTGGIGTGDGNNTGTGSGTGDSGTGDGNNTGGNNNEVDLSIFKNYINIGNNISIGANNQNISYTKNSAYGNSSTVGNNSSGYEPKHEPDLKNIIISINQNELSKIKDGFSSAQTESINTYNNIDINDKQYVKYNELNIENKSVTINNSKVMFEGNSTLKGLNTFSKISNSTIIFNGSVKVEDKINLPLVQNSIIVINGNFTIQNGLGMGQFENSILLVTGDLNISATSGYKINLVNSNIIIGGNVYSQNGLNITLNNSIFMSTKNFNFGNGLNGSADNSALICGGDMYIQNVNGNFSCKGKPYPENKAVLEAFYKYASISKY